MFCFHLHSTLKLRPKDFRTEVKMMFDWKLHFTWLDDGTDLVPCMSGGLFGITWLGRTCNMRKKELNPKRLNALQSKSEGFVHFDRQKIATSSDNVHWLSMTFTTVPVRWYTVCSLQKCCVPHGRQPFSRDMTGRFWRLRKRWWHESGESGLSDSRNWAFKPSMAGLDTLVAQFRDGGLEYPQILQSNTQVRLWDEYVGRRKHWAVDSHLALWWWDLCRKQLGFSWFWQEGYAECETCTRFCDLNLFVSSSKHAGYHMLSNDAEREREIV